MLLWVGRARIPLVIAFMMALPIVWANVREGLMQTDRKLLEMAKVFRVPAGRVMRQIRLPSLKPYFLAAARSAVSLAWKAGIAAELIGYPKGSVGGELYSAKQFLETADLFAWTVIIVLVSFITEKLISLLLKAVIKGVEK
jgi:NitT/TauT family transport system permease protein